MCLVPDYYAKGNLRKVQIPTWSYSYQALIVSQNEALLSKLESELIEKFQIR
jgi:hypothetical protein